MVRANGEVQTNEEAPVYVHDLDLFVTVQIIDDTLAVPSLGNLCEVHGYSYEWASGEKPHLNKPGKKIQCKTEIVYLLLSLDCRQILEPVRPLHRHRTRLIKYIFKSSNQRGDDRALGYWRDSPKTQKKKKKRDNDGAYRETDCETFQNGWSSLQKISEIKMCLLKEAYAQSKKGRLLYCCIRL